jgi:hypothetical protein
MSERYISVIPAQPGYKVSLNYEPFETVIAWGFTEWGGPTPITITGPKLLSLCERLDEKKVIVITPDGKEVEV